MNGGCQLSQFTTSNVLMAGTTTTTTTTATTATVTDAKTTKKKVGNAFSAIPSPCDSLRAVFTPSMSRSTSFLSGQEVGVGEAVDVEVGMMSGQSRGGGATQFFPAVPSAAAVTALGGGGGLAITSEAPTGDSRGGGGGMVRNVSFNSVASDAVDSSTLPTSTTSSGVRDAALSPSSPFSSSSSSSSSSDHAGVSQSMASVAYVPPPHSHPPHLADHDSEPTTISGGVSAQHPLSYHGSPSFHYTPSGEIDQASLQRRYPTSWRWRMRSPTAAPPLTIHDLRQSRIFCTLHTFTHSQLAAYTAAFHAHATRNANGHYYLPVRVLRHVLMDLGYYETRQEMESLLCKENVHVDVEAREGGGGHGQEQGQSGHDKVMVRTGQHNLAYSSDSKAASRAASRTASRRTSAVDPAAAVAVAAANDRLSPALGRVDGTAGTGSVGADTSVVEADATAAVADVGELMKSGRAGVDLAAFLHIMGKVTMVSLSQQQIHVYDAVFSFFDRDQSSSLSSEQVEALMLHMFHERMDASHLRDLLHEWDVSACATGSPTLAYPEFLSIFAFTLKQAELELAMRKAVELFSVRIMTPVNATATATATATTAGDDGEGTRRGSGVAVEEAAAVRWRSTQSLPRVLVRLPRRSPAAL